MEDHWRSTLKDSAAVTHSFCGGVPKRAGMEPAALPGLGAKPLFDPRPSQDLLRLGRDRPALRQNKGFVTLPSAGLPSSKPTAQSKQDPKALENRKLTFAP
jgi:hypothetical protein